MRSSILLGLAALALAVMAPACAAEHEDSGSEGEAAAVEDELRSLTLTARDSGRTVTLTQGQNLVVALWSSQSTGRDWHVASTTRSFGYPTTRRLAGYEILTWKTSGPLSLVGTHAVRLEYKADGSAPQRTFTFTVNVVAGSCPQLSPPAPNFCSGGRVTANKDENGCTTSFQCVTCPELSPPAPGFCPSGNVQPTIDANRCTTSYECVVCPTLSPPAPGFCPSGQRAEGVADANGCTSSFTCVPR